MSSSITPIETRYSGYRFRSRTEARWAVFFDHAGILWQYEPQGIICPDRLNLTGGYAQSYLPDFYLPDLDMWVEVKGSWNSDESKRFLTAAAYLSHIGSSVALISGVPRYSDDLFPTLPVLKLENDWLVEYAWHPDCGRDTDPFMGALRVVATPGAQKVSARDLLTYARWRTPAHQPTELRTYLSALDAARSARFEHGETGAA